MGRFKRLFAAMAIGLLASMAMIAPAQASNIYGCRNDVPNQKGQVCLYNWINMNQGGGWHVFSFEYLGNYSCTNLANHTWNTGGGMNDGASSVVINSLTTHSTGYDIWFYNWVNCNPDGGYAIYWVTGDDLRISENLGTISDAFVTTQTNWYDRWTSVKIRNHCGTAC